MLATGRDVSLKVADLNFAAEVTEEFHPGACGSIIPRAPAAAGRYTVRFTVPTTATPGAFSAEPSAGFGATDTAPNGTCPTLAY